MQSAGIGPCPRAATGAGKADGQQHPRAYMPESPDLRQFFEGEVLRLMNRLYGTALRLTRDAADAEDLVAETVAKAWEKRGDLRDRGSFQGWILRILANTFISDRRRRRSRPELDADLDAAEGAEEFSLFRRLHQPFLLWWGTPEHELLRKLLREDIEKALDALPEPFRIALVLVEVQGFSYAETSELLEVPIGTVRSRLSRGRALLQRALWEQAQDAGLLRGAEPRKGDA